MRLLSTLLAALVLSACAGTPPAAAPDVQQYPAWLEMKPGYAETCAKGGGCIPMTQAELQQMAMDIIQRSMQACRRLPST